MNDHIGSVAAGMLSAILGLAIVAVIVSNRSSTSGVIGGLFGAFQGLVTTAIGGATAGSANIPNSNAGASGSGSAGNLSSMASPFVNSAGQLITAAGTPLTASSPSASNPLYIPGTNTVLDNGSGGGVTTIYNDASQPGTTVYENDN